MHVNTCFALSTKKRALQAREIFSECTQANMQGYCVFVVSFQCYPFQTIFCCFQSRYVPKPDNHLFLSIFSCLCCPMIGVVAVIFAVQVQ